MFAYTANAKNKREWIGKLGPEAILVFLDHSPQAYLTQECAAITVAVDVFERIKSGFIGIDAACGMGFGRDAKMIRYFER